MEIVFSENKEITAEPLKALLDTVNWQVSRYPERLAAVMANFDRVYTAWDGERLVGLACSLADGGITAYIHYWIVHPDYQRRGIGKALLQKLLDAYRDYLRIELVADRKAVAYYQAMGFEVLDATAMCRISE